MADFATRRMLMVDTQVRPSDVTKFPIIEAMLAVPRERFVPADRREAAYVGEHVGLGGGRVLLDPRTFAKLLDAADPRPGEMALHVGAGLGYGPAVLARMVEFVAAVEDDPARAAAAQATLSETGADNVAIIEAPLAGGAPKCGPYDVILIEGAVEQVPQAIAGQLREGGRIAAIWSEGALGTARIGLCTGGRIAWRDAFSASAPVLPGFARERVFSL